MKQVLAFRTGRAVLTSAPGWRAKECSAGSGFGGQARKTYQNPGFSSFIAWASPVQFPFAGTEMIFAPTWENATMRKTSILSTVLGLALATASFAATAPAPAKAPVKPATTQTQTQAKAKTAAHHHHHHKPAPAKKS
jgi:hypothetical protein